MLNPEGYVKKNCQRKEKSSSSYDTAVWKSTFNEQINESKGVD